jgi:hypothetical protein
MTGANIICPVCRSTLQPSGHIDIGAASLQSLLCPVCGTPNFLSAGAPLPMTWDSLKIITRIEPVQTWKDVQASAPTFAQNIASLPSKETQSVYKDFSITQPLNNVLKEIGTAIASPFKGALDTLAPELIAIGAFTLIFLFIYMKGGKR